ncbi:alpha-galactosidase [Streptomyces sp. DW26H14]|uniref:alpha-galactosidase n=1 Tax=Streptomyces sp. DW26H14 TaxID=3435395 RepID=UPI00403DDC27
MQDSVRITVTLASGASAVFDGLSPDGVSPNGLSPDGLSPDGLSPDGLSPDGLSPGADGALVDPDTGIELRTSGTRPLAVTVRPPSTDDPIRSVAHDLFAPMANLRNVIVPDSGRWFMNGLQPISAWRFHRAADSAAHDVLTPLYVFTRPDGATDVALGLVGELYETRCEVVEPASNRALNVHVGMLGVRFVRGTPDHPIPAHVVAADGSVTDHLYVDRPGRDEHVPWSLALRRFSLAQRAVHDLRDAAPADAWEPVWCSWVDWGSEHLSEDLVRENAARGVDLGIRHFIIDDGWFGPGLDSSYDTPLNIGDWEPDPKKFPDLAGLVREIREMGGKTLIWCAPHAVGPAARCLPEREHLLMRDAAGAPSRSETQFHSLCFRCPQARDVMVRVCVDLLTAYDFDGAKYDLFNWLPPEGCQSTRHEHDTASMLHGLELTLAAVDEATRRARPGAVVELKQNYGTPFLTRHGSMTRAGDAPYAPETNFLRTLHVQGYCAASLNDYQTFTDRDSAQDVAVAVLTMMAVGIPAYGADLPSLSGDRAQVLRHHHRWYTERLPRMRRHRRPLDAAHRLMAVAAWEPADGDVDGKDIVFAVNDPAPVPWSGRPTTVLNATHADRLLLTGTVTGDHRARTADALGRDLGEVLLPGDRDCWSVPVPPGGRVDIVPATAAGRSQ